MTGSKPHQQVKSLVNSVASRKSHFATDKNDTNSDIKDSDSLFVKRLEVDSNVEDHGGNGAGKMFGSGNKVRRSDQHEEDQIGLKDTPNLKYSVGSKVGKDRLGYSKMSELDLDIWNSSKGEGQQEKQGLKMFNAMPRKKLDEDFKNSATSLKESAFSLNESQWKQPQQIKTTFEQ